MTDHLNPHNEDSRDDASVDASANSIEGAPLPFRSKTEFAQEPNSTEEQFPRKIKNWLDLPSQYDGTNVTLFFIFLNCFLTFASWNSEFVYQILILNIKSFQNFEFTRFVSSQFLHSDFKHLLSNLFLGSIFIYLLSAYFGPWRILVATFLAGTLTNFFSYFTMVSDPYRWLSISTDPELTKTSLLGFSGVVYFLGSLWMTLYYLTMRRLSHLNRSLRVIGVSLLIFFPSETFDPQTSYRTHLIGFVIGVGLGFLMFRRQQHRWAVELDADSSHRQ